MNNFDKNAMLAGLDGELAILVKNNKWNIKATQPIACLDVDAKQLWVLRFCALKFVCLQIECQVCSQIKKQKTLFL